MTLSIGDKAPDFEVEIEGKKIKPGLSDGKKIVLYFYPKDHSPGCAIEACKFRDYKEDFEKNNTIVIGVSDESQKAHDKFVQKYFLNYSIISDPEAKICKSYEVWKKITMYGRIFMGIEKSTFIIDENGKIKKIWRNVIIGNHVEEILDFLKE
jgi:peroxiredoxin Q/BCP